MGQVRHGNATTTYPVRAAIQRSQASLAQLSRETERTARKVYRIRDEARADVFDYIERF